jgi:NADH-quinone oxidoreductase subunit L
MIDYAWLLLAFPAAGALIILFFGGWMNRKIIGAIGVTAVVAAFAVAVALLFGVSQLPPEEREITLHLWDWITVGAFQVNAAMLIDPLSIVMALVVTGVGAVIHLYSMGYMAHDERYQRFFFYMNFFILAMLILVTADSFLGMFVGWEGVGLASYLLIGFWFDRRDDSYGWYADAGKKAFLVNRVGDFGMILAIIIIWSHLGTVTFLDAFAGAGALTTGAATLITLLLFLAASAKSAQIPLYIWLPDAMAGPTPVSALIHAATMVTAGVYMMVRTNAFWHLAPASGNIAAWLGILTAFFAATIALVQTDLKKILAYSTISQLGYMVMAAAVGAYGAAIFHLMTHAFFKALLFLGAGSVMHATDGELDIRKMGGLRKKMPTTYITFLIGAAALSGFPLMSGFFSKDAILLGAMTNAPLVYIVGLITALLTAFYSFRMVFVSFHGEPRDQELYDHAHESPLTMTIPLWILAVLAVIGGLINLPGLLNLEHWLEPVIGHHEEALLILELLGMVISAAVVLFGIYMAYARYIKDEEWVQRWADKFVRFKPWMEHKYWVDEFYNKTIVQPLRRLAGWFARFDRKGIDGVVNGTGSVSVSVGERLRHLQNGLIPTYVLSIFIGVVVVVLYFLFMV